MASPPTLAAPRRRRQRFSLRPFLRLSDRLLKLVLVALVIGLAIYGCLELYNRTLLPYTIKIATYVDAYALVKETVAARVGAGASV
ncbi:MAG: hypothetical protein HGA45_12040 [Chloroflexales bacterium]|nr:hypothetical protein [Chloroflexales bacterium]